MDFVVGMPLLHLKDLASLCPFFLFVLWMSNVSLICCWFLSSGTVSWLLIFAGTLLLSVVFHDVDVAAGLFFVHIIFPLFWGWKIFFSPIQKINHPVGFSFINCT